MRILQFAAHRSIVRVGGLSLVAGLLIGGTMVREPTFEGRTVRSWLMDAAYGRNYATCKGAVEFFKRTGIRTVPSLIPIIEARGFRVSSWLKGHPWLFSHLPSGVQKAVDEEIEQELHLRTWAISICGIVGPSAGSAEPALLRSCADSDRGIRAAAADALASTHAQPTLAIPIMLQMLGDKDTCVRSIAAMALGQYGPLAKSAVPALQKARKDPDDGVASLAAGAVLQIEHPEVIANARQLRPIRESRLGSISNEMRNFSSALSDASRLSYDGSP